MHGIIGVIIGVVIELLIIKPLEKRRYRKMCEDAGLVPHSMILQTEVEE